MDGVKWRSLVDEVSVWSMFVQGVAECVCQDWGKRGTLVAWCSEGPSLRQDAETVQSITYFSNLHSSPSFHHIHRPQSQPTPQTPIHKSFTRHIFSTTTQQTMLSTHAAQQVLGTAELLEMILSNCSATDCGRVQQLSTFCRDAVAGSKILRRIMFLEPQLEAMRVFTLAKDINDIQGWQKRAFYEPFCDRFVIGKIHPALGNAREEVINKHHSGTQILIDKLKLENWTAGPWEQMFITQPPGLVISIQRTGKKKKIKAKTLGQLRDAVLKRYEGSSSSVKIFVHGYFEEEGGMVWPEEMAFVPAEVARDGTEY